MSDPFAGLIAKQVLPAAPGRITSGLYANETLRQARSLAAELIQVAADDREEE